MSRRRLLAWLALPAVVLVTVAAWPALRGLKPDTGIPTARVERGDFIRRVEAEGTLEAVNATVLTAPITIEKPVKIAWLAEDGSRVSAGDVVVRFDPSDMEQDLEDGLADRDSAQSKIRQGRITGDTTLKNLDRDADMAGRELDYAREFQSKDADIFSRSEIIESEIDESLAEQRQSHAVDSRGIHEELSQVSLDLLAIERRKAEIQIDKAEEGLDALELTAPHDGILVLQETWTGPIAVGSMAWRGNPVAEIPDLEEMQAEVWVLEADAGGLSDGLEATVMLEAHPDREYAATVKTVDALPKRRVRWSPVQFFSVTLELERTEPEVMKPGQRVRALLTLERLEDVLTVPREAVFEQEGKKVAWVARGGGFEAVEIEPGAAALGRVVILSGLERGDRVALRDPTRPDDGADENEPDGTNGPTVGGG